MTRKSKYAHRYKFNRSPSLVGMQFGRLTVLKMSSEKYCGNQYWECQCSCGNITAVQAGSLKRMLSLSCGCLRAERVGNASRTHGKSKTPTYRIWTAMLDRVRNPKNKDYKNYGMRGISVCERWLSFENFLADMGERPEGLTLERENNNGNYEPNNCKWATRLEQTRNRRPRSEWATTTKNI